MKQIMKKYLGAVSMVALAGCYNLDTGLIPLGAVIGEFDMATNTCTFDSGSEEYYIDLNYDPSAASSLRLSVKLMNIMEANTIEFSSMSPMEVFTPPNHVTPLRFDMRWECDSDALSAGLGPLILPQFSFDQPFCFNNRDDTTGNFVGFDIIPVNGSAIAPGGGTNLATINPVTPQMGMALDDMFEIARLADDCCQEDVNCESAVMRGQASYGPACSALNNIFVRLGDPNGIQRTEGAQGNLLIARLRRFSIFDGQSNNRFGQPGAYANYQMRLRGVFEGITPDGDLITSTEYSTLVGFCRGCGMFVCTDD